MNKPAAVGLDVRETSYSLIGAGLFGVSLGEELMGLMRPMTTVFIVQRQFLLFSDKGGSE